MLAHSSRHSSSDHDKEGGSHSHAPRWKSPLPLLEGQTGFIVTIGSFLVNIIVIFLLFSSRWAATTSLEISRSSSVNSNSLTAAPGSQAELSEQLRTWKSSHETIRGQFETLKARYIALQEAHAALRRSGKASSAAPQTSQSVTDEVLAHCQGQLAKVQEQLKAGAAASHNGMAVALPPTCPPCHTAKHGFLDHSRLLATDLALSKFDFGEHETTWTCQESVAGTENEALHWCPESPTNEQWYQLSFFDRPGAGSRDAVRKPKPQAPNCVQLPPHDYRFPPKVQSMPLAEGDEPVHWANLRVQKLEDLLVFNRGTPKNLYHFNASFYDYEQEGILDSAAKYIPFSQKVRLMLDIGSGGASLGMLAKRRYDVQVVSTVFADWPYCEYITERGQICMYLDAQEAMPFSKFSYDVVHSSWVFHALHNHQLRAVFLEQNRILRPGGYLWLYGGWSKSQVETIEYLLVKQLGYKFLLDDRKYVDTTKVKTSFDSVPFQLEWTAILLKPIKVDEIACKRVYEAV